MERRRLLAHIAQLTAKTEVNAMPETDTPTMERAIPVLASLDLESTQRFYAERLGFERLFTYPDYAISGRDGVQVHFWLTDDPAHRGEHVVPHRCRRHRCALRRDAGSRSCPSRWAASRTTVGIQGVRGARRRRQHDQVRRTLLARAARPCASRRTGSMTNSSSAPMQTPAARPPTTSSGLCAPR